jgi:DNA repair exonuclease SbcCD ATPase subunit
MITIQNASLHNFMSVTEANLDFTGAYINVFHGANGSGKSTLMEAIAICFTERRRGDSYKDFIQHGSEEGASVILNATIHGEPIKFDVKIVDKLGHSPFQRYITYKGTVYKNSECTTLLESFDLEYLQQILFSMQTDSNITDLKPGDRTKVLKKLFNYEFTEQLAELDKLVEADQQALLINNTKLQAALKRTFTYQPLRPLMTSVEKQNARVRLEELKVLEANVKAKDDIKAGIKRQFDAVNARVTSLASQRNTAAEDIRRLEASIATQKTNLDKYQKSLDSLVNEAGLLAQIAQKQQTIETLQALLAQNESLHETLGTEMESRSAEMGKLQQHIAAHEKGECPACGQSTKPEEVPLMKEVLEKEQVTFGQLAAQRRKALADKTATDASVFSLKGEIQKLQNDISTNNTLRTQSQEFVQQTANTVATSTDTLTKKQADYEALKVQHASALLELEKLSATLKAETSTVDWGFIEMSRIELELKEDDINASVNIEIARLNAITKKDEDGIEAERSLYAKTQNDIYARLANYKEARQILEVHLPNYIIVKACSKLEHHINSFIENVKPGMIVRLFQNKRGVEFFYSPKGASIKMDEWMTTRMASGFERELLAMAWRVALAKAFGLTTLILDEIDSAASTAASEKMFRELANVSGFEQLFIITHKPEIVDILVQESDKVSSYYVSDGTFTLQSY